MILLILVGIHLCAVNGWTANEVTINENNRVLLNGEPFFPIGLYVVECTNGTYLAELDTIADSPFNTLMNYAVNACGSEASYQQIRDYLDQLALRNLNVMFSLKEYISACSDPDQDGIQDCNTPGPLSVDAVNTITEKVTNHMDHNSVVAWYLNDETCPACLEQLEDGYNLIKTLDGNHPVWSVQWNPSWLLQEAHTTDIVGADSYPVPDNPITWVSDVVDKAMKAGKPLWFVPQLFDWWNKRPPTKEEMRAMTYLATNHGAQGLIYYSYFDIRGDDDYQERWDAVREIAGEIDQLKDVFLSIEETNEDDIVCDNPNIDFKLMRKADTYYLFAVNIAQEFLADVSFQVLTADKPARIETLFEDTGTFKPDTSCSFRMDFQPYDVHVFKWSSHCQAGDLDGNGTVGSLDVALFAADFGTINESCPSTCDADLDDDGDIDGTDLQSISSGL